MKPKVHRYKSIPTNHARKGRHGQTKRVRNGVRHPGGSGHGTIRHPY